MIKIMRGRFPLLLWMAVLSAFANAQQGSATIPATNAQPTNQSTPQATTPEGAPSEPRVYESSTVLKVKTRLVVLDVVAQNNKGVPVTDLKAEDFTLTEDGKPQNIRSFSFQRPGDDVSKAPISTLPANVVNNLPRYRPNGALNVVLLDALNSNLPDQAYMRDEMVKFLQKLPDGEPIAIYLLGAKLRLVQDFTTDPALLKAAINNLKSPGTGIVDNPAGTSPLTDLPTGSIAGSTLMMVPQLRGQILAFQNERIAAQTDFRIRYTLDALNSLGRTLAGYPGRKNLIWISENFPFDTRVITKGASNSRSYSQDVSATGSLLSDAQVAVYPIDARGLINHSVYSAGSDSDPMSGFSRMKSTLNGPMGQQMDANADELMAAHATMNDMAEKTGGKAFYNQNNLESAVRESLSDGSTYYTLAYYPDNKDWNGDFRKIHLKVDRPGVKLRYRLGYLAVDRAAFAKANPARQDSDFDQALSLDWPVATTLPFQAQVLGPSPETQNKVLVRYRIEPRGLNFEQGADGLHHVAVLCAVRAFSSKTPDKPVKAEANKLEGPLRADAYDRIIKGFFPCQEQLELPAGDYILRIGVRDNSTGLIGTATARVTVPAAGAAEGAGKAEEKKP